ncbi:MAG: hypothetical protein ACYSOW_00990 [Planctomycetota bacterium]|jgi:hypothetical protein
MKKGKFSWQIFLMTLLVIVLLGCLVYYLEQNKVLEGIENMKTPSPSADNMTDVVKAETKPSPPSLKEPAKVNIDKGTDTARAAVTKPKKAAHSASQLKTDAKVHKDTKVIKDGFTNMLSYSPVASQGPQPGCVDSLKPYEKYNCGPIDVNNFFGGLKFKPECCGNPAGSSYSNSVGCACICPEQWTFLNSRGGNRTFPTEF